LTLVCLMTCVDGMWSLLYAHALYLFVVQSSSTVSYTSYPPYHISTCPWFSLQQPRPTECSVPLWPVTNTAVCSVSHAHSVHTDSLHYFCFILNLHFVTFSWTIVFQCKFKIMHTASILVDWLFQLLLFCLISLAST